MDNPSSPLDTLRQLKEMLDAGALTPAEFEALKQRLVFQAPTVLIAPLTPPVAPAPLVAPVPDVQPLAPPVVPTAPSKSAIEFHALPSGPAAPRAEPVYVPPAYVSPAYILPVTGSPSNAPVPPAPRAMYVPEPELMLKPVSPYAAEKLPEPAAPKARNPLMLFLIIGGVVALLSLVFYLSSDQRPSERISSTSLTPADTLATTIETGPQAQQMPASPAAPETIRVVPARPASLTPAPRPAPSVRDSVAAMPDAAADSAAR